MKRLISLKKAAAALAFSAGLLTAATPPVFSNGFTHSAFWNSADSCLYHVSVKGADADTHLTRAYKARVLSKDTLLARVGGLLPDTAYRPRQFSGMGMSVQYRNDTLFTVDTLEGYSPAFIKKDTSIAVLVGTLGHPTTTPVSSVNFTGLNELSPEDYLLIGGRLAKIQSKKVVKEYTDNRTIFFVDANIPTGEGLSLNGVFRTRPDTRLLTSDCNYQLLADPNQPARLFLFYISDMGRIVGLTSSNNGLNWQHLAEAENNTVLTAVSDQSRNALNVSMNTYGKIFISWTGSDSTSSAVLNVSTVIDTLHLYVDPNADSSADDQFTTVTTIEAFRTAASPATAFHSIDRAIHQMIMLENGKTRTEILTSPLSPNGPDNTRATATRSYVINLLPGEYASTFTDKGIDASWNKVLFPGWDRSLTVRSLSANPDSFAVVTTTYTKGLVKTASPNGFRTNSMGDNHLSIDNYAALQNINIQRLKFTGPRAYKEAPTSGHIITLPDYASISDIRFEQCLFFSVDSTNLMQNGLRTTEGLIKSSLNTPSLIDNVLFSNCLFHRLKQFNTYVLSTSRNDYGSGTTFAYCTFYNWSRPQYWSGHGHFGPISMVNCIIDSAADPFINGFTNPRSFKGSRQVSCLKPSGESIYLDTAIGSQALLMVPSTQTEYLNGYRSNVLMTLFPTDFYGLERNNLPKIGACGPLSSAVLPYTDSLLGVNLSVRLKQMVPGTVVVNPSAVNYNLIESDLHGMLKKRELKTINITVSSNIQSNISVAEIRMNYDATVKGIADTNFYLYTSSDNGINWKPVVMTVDTAKNQIIAQVRHFSQYALFTKQTQGSTSSESRTAAAALHLSVSPNPATSTLSQVRFTLPENGHVAVQVFDISGKKVRTLVSGAMPKGLHSVVWNGLCENGRSMASGIYMIRLEHNRKVLKQLFSVIR